MFAVYGKIILRRVINGSLANEKSLASSNKKQLFHLQFIVSELQNFPLKAVFSRTSNNKHDSVCCILSVADIKWPLLLAAHVIVYLQLKFKESLFSLDGLRTTSFLPNNGH